MSEFNKSLLEINDNPIQRGGLRPELTREATVPPLGHRRDTRWVIDVKALKELLSVAERSPTGRVIVHHCSIRVRTWKDPGSQHTFETYTILGQKIEPEVISLPGQSGSVEGRGTVA